MILSRDQILSVNDRKTEVVTVPEWGGDVIVSVMSGEQRDAYESMITEVDAKEKLCIDLKTCAPNWWRAALSMNRVD